MKKLLTLLLLLPILTTACQTKDTEINPDKIYLFYSTGCPHCHHAMQYINAKHPDLPLTKVNIAEKSGYDLFLRCAAKFNLGSRIGTPLFCMGDEYIMGWAPEYERRFDIYARPYQKRN